MTQGEPPFTTEGHILQANPSLEDCQQAGIRARDYGRPPRPWGHWTQNQVDAYMAAYKSTPSPEDYEDRKNG